AASRWYRRRLLEETVGRDARMLLERRGIDDAMSEAFMLGIAPDAWDGLCSRITQLDQHARAGDANAIPFAAFEAASLVKRRNEGNGHYDVFRNRLIFPICDELGRPIAFGARSLSDEDQPKYLNSPESSLFDKSRTLYGLHLARKPIIDAGHAIVVEGYTDAIACHQAGFKNTVATLGTALTAAHARKLQQFCNQVTLLFDGDKAGQKAADRASEIFFDCDIDVKICTLPEGADPDDMLKTDEGRIAFTEALNAATDILEHIVKGFRARFRDSEGVTSRQRTIEQLIDRLATLGLENASGTRKHLVLDSISMITGIPESDLTKSLAQRRRQARAQKTTYDPPSGPGDEMIDEENGTIVEPKDVAIDISPRRMEAERRVLAIFICNPELARNSVDAGEGMMLPATELFPPEHFLDHRHRGLADILIPAIEAGETPAIDQLLLAVEDPSIAMLITELYRYGTAIMDNSEDSATVMMTRLCDDLARTNRLEHFAAEHADPAGSPHDQGLGKRLEMLRMRGSDRTVIPRVERPKKPVNPTPYKAQGQRRGR
ncbi:MAG TPA: hypothetical protein DCX60_07505, partial [Phycisphaerales bacterium]|nr:hypothetical protein [Phycisphaerales bacterium]